MRCVWVDGALTKACRVLWARLGRLGWRVLCRKDLPDPTIAELASKMGCVVVSTDRFSSRRYGWVYIPHWYAERKSARDLATHIVKRACTQARGGVAAGERGVRS